MSGRNVYIWSAINRFGVQALLFIGNILIARQLTPDDYGLVAMLAIFMGIALNFTDSGFSDCLIRKSTADKLDFGTVLTYNLVVGSLIYILIFWAAPYIATYFDRNELIKIARIIGLSIPINALTITEYTRLRRELKFKELAKIDLLANFLMILSAYLLARLGMGYWALVFQSLALGLAKFFILILLTQWIPRLYFNLLRFKEMSRFSFNLLTSYLVNQVSQNFYTVIIGKFQQSTGLGFYRLAHRIKEMPVSGINAIILTTSYPVISKEKDEIKRDKLYESLLGTFLFIHFFVVFFLMGITEPLIYLLLGEKWIQSASYLQLMLIAALLMPLMTINANIAKVTGNAKLYRNLGFLRAGLSITALLITMLQSIQIILFGQIIAAYISVIIDVVFCGKLTDFGAKRQVKTTLNQIWIPLISMILSFISTIPFSSNILCFSIYTIIFFLTYLLISEITKNKQYLSKKQLILLEIKKLRVAAIVSLFDKKSDKPN